MKTDRSAKTLLLASALLALGLPLVLGAAPGVFQAGTQPNSGLGDPAYPDFEDGPGLPGSLDRVSTCAGCHAGYRAPGEPIYEPFDSWAGSMMAMAARDPLRWAAVDIANQDDAEHFGDIGIGDYCLRCHLPQGWLEGRARCDTPWGEEFDGACFEGDKSTPDSDFEGITCHCCHRMDDA